MRFSEDINVLNINVSAVKSIENNMLWPNVNNADIHMGIEG